MTKQVKVNGKEYPVKYGFNALRLFSNQTGIALAFQILKLHLLLDRLPDHLPFRRIHVDLQIQGRQFRLASDQRPYASVH